MADSIAVMSQVKTDIEQALLSNLYIKAKVTLVVPRTIERSMGKAVRIIDKRVLEGKWYGKICN